jgi:hypothetical protein
LQSPIANLIDQLGVRLCPAEIPMLERLAGMEAPPQERLGFLGQTAGPPCGAPSRCARRPEVLDRQKAGARTGTPACEAPPSSN